VRASGSASVTAYDSASVRASGSASVRAYDSASVRAGKYVSVHVDRGNPYNKPKITGGVLIEVPPIDSIESWCDLYGLEILDGAFTAYKALDDDYATSHSRRAGIFYTPGSDELVAPDWKTQPQCGNGLHVAPTPSHALRYNGEAKRFISMRVAVADVRPVQVDDDMGKVKARRVFGPFVEVDVDGKPLVAHKVKRTRKVKAAA
jgi:hypothetical protein